MDSRSKCVALGISARQQAVHFLFGTPCYKMLIRSSLSSFSMPEGLEDRRIVVRILAGEETCLYFTIHRPFLMANQPPIYWADPALPSGVKRPLIPPNAEVNREQSDTSSGVHSGTFELRYTML